MRQREHLAEVKSRFPNAWNQMEHFRQLRGLELPLWPAWCYVPLSGAYAVVSGGGTNRVPPQDAPWIGIIGALAAWRLTQGIYRFDPEVFDAVVKTKIDRKLPDQVLFRLPEWCVYVELPETFPWAGFYAHLEEDQNTGRRELRLVLDERSRNHLVPIPIHLTGGALADGIEAMVAEAGQHDRGANIAGKWSQGHTEHLSSQLAPLVSLLLYLCSADREIQASSDPTRRPRYPSPKKTKNGSRWFPVNEPTVWETAFELGRRLRQTGGGGSHPHASPRPHVRVAHWHSFWKGPRSTPEKRKLVVRWLPPILVNADPNDIIPTVRHVRNTSS